MELHNVSDIEFRQLLNKLSTGYLDIVKLVKDSFEYNFDIAIWKAFWVLKEGGNPLWCTENIRMSDIKKFL